MNKREFLLANISKYLGILESQVQLRNSLNLLDINIHAEQFYRILLNKIFGYELVNLNFETGNAAAIDLSDKTRGIAFQITSNNSLKKINETVDKFYDNKLHIGYPI